MTTGDNRDIAQMRHFMSRSAGMRVYAPAVRRSPGNALCDCVVDPHSGRSYCVCASAIASDMLFAPDKMSRVMNPHVRFASPCERSALKRRQAFIAMSLA